MFAFKVNAGLLFNYSQLAVKDLDQINKLVNEKIKESKKTSSGKFIPLREALQAVYSRPNEDSMIDKVVAPLRSELDNLDAWEKTIRQLTDEALGVLKRSGTFTPPVQVTYALFLHNLLAELKPYIKEKGFERQIVEKIRDAHVDVSKEARHEIKIRMMKSLLSPSDVANQILIKATEPQTKLDIEDATTEVGEKSAPPQ